MSDLRIVGGETPGAHSSRFQKPPPTFTCIRCGQEGPWAKFYDQKRKVRSPRCGKCRFELRIERRRRKQAREARLLRKDLDPVLLGQDPNYKYQRPANRDPGT